MAQSYVYARCNSMTAGIMAKKVKLCDSVEMVNVFCYIGDRLNASGSSEAAVTARTKIGRINFRECSEVLCNKCFLL